MRHKVFADRRIGLLIELVIYLAGAIFLSWGDAFNLPGQGVDESWAEGLVYATDNGRVFGSDTIFFYGPYHQIATGQLSENLGPLLRGRWLSGIAFGSLIVLIKRMSSVIWGLAILFLLFLTVSQNYNVLFPLLAAVTLIASSLLPLQTKSNLLLIGLCQAGLVLGIFIKLSFTGSAFIGLLCSLTIMILRLKGQWSRTLCIAITCLLFSLLAMFPFLWLLASQPLEAFARYFTGPNADIVKGYSSAMTHQDFSIVWQIPIYWTGATIITLTFQQLLSCRNDVPSKLEQTISILALSTTFWVIFKSGMVRHESLHAAIAGGYLFSVAMVIASITATQNNEIFHRIANPLAPLALLAIPIIAGFTIVDRQYASTPPTPIHRKIKSSLINASILAGTTFGHNNKSNRTNLSLLRIKMLHQLKPLSEHFPINSAATVDILPWDIIAIRAGGHRYQPSPVLQSISAYTEKLQKINALHFQGKHRPDFVVLQARSIDNRPPLDLLGDDGYAAIARNYRFAGHGSKGSLLYQSREDSDSVQDVQFNRVYHENCCRLTQGIHAENSHGWMTLPTLTAGSYMTVKIEGSNIRKLLSFLYKPAAIEILFRLSNNRTKSFTLVDQATNLIPLNPFVRNNEDLRHFIDAASRTNRSSAEENQSPTPIKLMIREWSHIPTINSAVIDIYSPLHASTNR